MKRSTPESDMYARSASPDLREIKQKLNLATDTRYSTTKDVNINGLLTELLGIVNANLLIINPQQLKTRASLKPIKR